MAFEKGHTINVGRRSSQSTRKKLQEIHKNDKPYLHGAGFKPGNTPWQVIMAQNAYFAGLLDGEGSIFTANNGVKRPGQGNYKSIRVVFAMVRDKAQPLSDGQLIWGGNLYERKPRESIHKWVMDWRMSSRVAENFLKSVYPYLKIKHQQAKLALEYIDHQHKCMGKKMTEEVLGYRKKIEDEIKFLNR